jgi:hypothetical protein
MVCFELYDVHVVEIVESHSSEFPLYSIQFVYKLLSIQQFLSYYPANSRFQNIIISSAQKDESEGSNNNVLTKEQLIQVMKLHQSIQNGVSTYDGQEYTFADLCTVAGG